MYFNLQKAGVLDLWFEPIYEREFEVGDWIIFLSKFDGKPVGYTTKIEELNTEAPFYIYNENISGVWCSYDNGNGGFKIGENGFKFGIDFRLATDKEIEEHLITEAKRRGFKDGVKYKYPDKPHIGERKCVGKFYVNSEKDLCDGEETGCSYIIYNNGSNIWAEIIKDEKIVISGYTAKFDKVNKTVSFGYKIITLEELKAVLIVVNMNDRCNFALKIGAINISGVNRSTGNETFEVNKKTIEKLIKILEDE